MNMKTEEQLESLREKISKLKQLLGPNEITLYHIFHPDNYRLITFLFGLVIILTAGVYEYCLRTWGNYQDIPLQIRQIIIMIIALVCVLLGILKIRILLASLKKIDPNITLIGFYKKIFATSLVDLYLSILTTAILICIYLSLYGKPLFIVPVVSITFGVMFLSFRLLTSVKLYGLTGDWFLITGIAVLFFQKTSIPIAIATTIGGGMIFFAIFSLFPGLKQSTPLSSDLTESIRNIVEEMDSERYPLQ